MGNLHPLVVVVGVLLMEYKVVLGPC